MSQANWDRSTIGGAGPGTIRRRMLGIAAAGLAAGFVAGFAGGAALAQARSAMPAPHGVAEAVAGDMNGAQMVMRPSGHTH